MSKIILTGATGNVGKHLLKLVLESGMNYVAVSSNPEKIQKLRAEKYNADFLDFNSEESMSNIFEKGDVLFLLNPLQENMLAYIENAVEAAKAKGIKFILRLSGMGSNPDSELLYSRRQGKADKMIIESGIDYSIICPNSFMQNFAVYYSEMIKNSNAVFLAHGAGKVSYIDVRDIAQAAFEILKNPAQHKSKIYELTGNEALSNYEIAAILSDVSGKNIKYIEISENDAAEAMRKAGVPEWNIRILSGLDMVIRNNYASALSGAYKMITNQEPIDFKQFALDYKEQWM